MASLFERWIATLAEVASDAVDRFGRRVPIEALEDGDGFKLRRVSGGDLGRVDREGALRGAGAERLAGAAADVRLGGKHQIVDRVAYPAATRAYLGAVIGNQIDRLAPFEDGDAVFAWKIDDSAPTDETIRATVSVVSRKRIVEALRPLVLAGLVPVRVVAGGEGSAPPVTVPLGGGRDIAAMRRLMNGLVAALVVVGVAGFLGNWWLQHRLDDRLTDLDATVAMRRSTVEQAVTIGSAATGGQKRVADIIAGRSRLDTLPILNRLSMLLPDSVYLTDLEVQGAGVRISGSAVDAAPLVPLLENDPQIENVHFTAPLAREQDTNRVGFDLAFTWLPSP